MRWNCPHCGTQLAVADEKMGNGWSFSRCYKCAGHALIRRSDINLIKVDRAPAGEQVLLPEAHEEPTTLMSQAAANHLARYMTPNNAKKAAAAQEAKPIVKAAPRRSMEKPPTQSPLQTLAKQIRTAPHTVTPVATAPRPTEAPRASTPAPVIANAAAPANAPTSTNTTGNTTPPANANAATTAAAAVTPVPTRASAIPPKPPQITARNSFGLQLPEPLPEQPVQGVRHRLLPAAIGLTGILAIGSGIFLYVQGQAMWEKARQHAAETQNGTSTPAASNAGSEIIRAPSLTSSAMAPTPPAAVGAETQAPTAQNTQTAPNIPAAAAPTAGSASIQSIASHTLDDVTDRVHSKAMAPARDAEPAAVEVTPNSPATAKMAIEILVNNAHLHSGPGMEYPVIATASSHQKYAVEEWRDRWFKIVLEKQQSRAARNPAPQKKTAWIRNDLVRMAP